MQLSQNIEKTIFPMKIIWLALMASIAIYAFVIFQIKGIHFEDLKNIDAMKTVLFPAAFVPFIFTFFCSLKKNWLIKKLIRGNTAPYLKNMETSDQEYLKSFGAYFIFHILMWVINEMSAILGFMLSFISGNVTYYIICGSFALASNFILFKPNYQKYNSQNVSKRA